VAADEVRPNSFSACQVVLARALSPDELTVWQASSYPNRAGARERMLILASAIVPLIELKIVKQRTSSYTISVRFLYGYDFHSITE
jgi:hypothetical protein